MDWKRSSERRDTEQVLVKAAEAERGPAQKGQTVEKTGRGGSVVTHPLQLPRIVCVRPLDVTM